MQLDIPQADNSLVRIYKHKVLSTSIIILVLLAIPIALSIADPASIVFWLLYLSPYLIVGMSGIFLHKNANSSRLSTLIALFICLLVYCIINTILWIIIFMVLLISVTTYKCNSSEETQCSLWTGLGWLIIVFASIFAIYFLISCFIAIRGIRVSRMLKIQLANQANSNQVNMLSQEYYMMQGQNFQPGFNNGPGYQQFSGSNHKIYWPCI